MSWQYAPFVVAFLAAAPTIAHSYRRIFQELRRRDWRTGAPRT